MKRIIVSIVLILSSISIHAQSTDLLIGKWIFKDAYNKDKIDAEGLAQLNSDIINKMSFEFSDNGDYKAYLMGALSSGTWIRTEEKNIFILNTPDGPFELRILKLTTSELALKYGLGEFLMVKQE